MAEFSWTSTTPLSRALHAGHHGAAGAKGVAVTELRDFELIQVMARRGQWGATAKAAKVLFGKAPPAQPLAVQAGATRLIWSGPDQFLVLSPRAAGNSALEAAKPSFAGAASLSDQSDGRALIRISGPRARDMLAKFCSLDLHPEAFPVTTAATTAIDHTSANLWRGEDGADGPVFNLLVFSSFAESLWHMILDSGAEYGIEIGAAAWQA